MRRIVAVAVVAIVVVVVVGALSASRSDTSQANTVPDTTCPSSTVNQLVAQSVPTASLVPCVAAFGTRWSIDGEDYTSHGTSLSMTGRDAEEVTWKVEVRESCDTTGLEPTGDDAQGAEVWRSDEQTSSTFTRDEVLTFEGGCVASDVSFPVRFDRALVLGDVDAVLQLVPRAALDQQVVQRSDGALTLDPTD